jgi:hypothetical protein
MQKLSCCVLTSKAVYLHSYKARDDHLWDPGDPKRSAQLRCGEWNRLGRSLQHLAQLIGGNRLKPRRVLKVSKTGPDSAADDAGGFPAEIGAVSVPMANGS